MNRTALLLSIWITFCSESLAQTGQRGTGADFSYTVKVVEVDFLCPGNKIPLLRDYYPNPPIAGVAWKPSEQNPVGFPSGKKITVTAKFANCTGRMWAKGDGPSGFDPPIVELVNGNYSGLMPIEFPANQVGFYDPFEIQWSVSTASDPNGNWLPAGKSASPVYIVYTTSLVAGDNYHSLFYYGCKNAHGLNNPDVIVDNMYLGTFSGRTVPRKDNPTKGAMSYWGTSGSAPEPACFETAGLLRYEDGRCGAWARFFSDMIKAQGIGGGEIAQVVWQRSPSSLFLEFLSNKFTFFGLQSNQVQVDPPDATALIPQIFINNYQLAQTTTPNHFYVWGSEFVGDISSPWTPITLNNQNILLYGPLDGAAAQGNKDPQSTFVNHALVKYNNKYFDSSYGSPIFTSKNEWENYALAGLGNGGGSLFKFYVLGVPFVERLMYVSEFNNPNLQCTINP